MRIVIQRVGSASVEVSGERVGAIGEGLLLLVGIADSDKVEDARAAAQKVSGLRIFADHAGQMNLSVADVDGSVLAVSQFTLLGDARRGRRPSFTRAARPDAAMPLFDHFVDAIRDYGISVETGAFGSMMQVRLVNEGPVTIVLDIENGRVV